MLEGHVCNSSQAWTREEAKHIAPGTCGRAYRVSISPHSSPEKDPSSFCNPEMSTSLVVKEVDAAQQPSIIWFWTQFYTENSAKTEPPKNTVTISRIDGIRHYAREGPHQVTCLYFITKQHTQNHFIDRKKPRLDETLRNKDTWCNFIGVYSINPVKQSKNLHGA